MIKQGEGQRNTILKVLKSGAVVTLQDFRSGYDIANPNARISELVEAGHPIVKKWRDVVRDCGFKTAEMTYSLPKKHRSR